MDFGGDHYDFFNAPQYVDFNELVHGTSVHDDDVDKYFETHTEEDDFLPVCTSPNTGATVIPAQFDMVYDVEAYYKNKESSDEPEPNPASSYTSEHPESEQQEVPTTDAEEVYCVPESTDCVVPENTDGPCEAHQAYNQTTPPVAAYITVESENAEERTEINPITAQNEDAGTEVAIKVELEDQETLGTEAAAAGNEHICEDIIPSTDAHADTGIKQESAPTEHLPQVPSESNCPIPDTSRLTPTPAKSSYSSSSLPRTFKLNAATNKKPVMKITIPQPFKFSETRPRVHKVQEPQNDATHRPKHGPVKVMQGTCGMPRINPPRTTQPIEIHFASDDRIRQRQANRKSAPVAPVEQPKYNSLPRQSRASVRSVGGPSSSREKLSSSMASDQQDRPRCRSRSSSREVIKTPTPTQIKPFSFDDRDKNLQRRKQEKIMKAIEAESKVKEFHAQPVPNFSATLKKLPVKKAPELTHPEPFKLKCDLRGAHYQEMLSKKLEEEERLKREQATFQALPNEVIYKKPFEPAKSTIPVPEPIDPGLSTDRRAEERARFDHMIKQREAELEELKKKEKVLHELQEEKFAQEMRKMCVHKAKPAPRYKFFEVKNSGKPLTDPNSPAFQPLPSQRRQRESNKENVQ